MIPGISRHNLGSLHKPYKPPLIRTDLNMQTGRIQSILEEDVWCDDVVLNINGFFLFSLSSLIIVILYWAGGGDFLFLLLEYFKNNNLQHICVAHF